MYQKLHKKLHVSQHTTIFTPILHSLHSCAYFVFSLIHFSPFQ